MPMRPPILPGSDLNRALGLPLPGHPVRYGGGYAGAVHNTPGLVAYWRLGEVAGTTAIDVTGYNHGTYIGSPGLGIASLLPSDRQDTAVDLSGASTEGVNFSASPSLNTVLSAASWEAWIVPDVGTLSVRRELAQRAIASDNWWWTLQSQKLALFLPGVITGGVYLFSTATIPEGVATHVVTTWDGSNVRHYINGVLDSTQATTAGTLPANSTQDGAIGYNRPAPGGTASYAGLIDEVSVYNVALTDAQVLAHYNAASTFTNLLALTVTQDTSASVVRRSGWIRTASQSQTPSLPRSVSSSRSSAQPSTATLLKRVASSLSGVQASASTLIKQARQSRAATATSAVTLATQKAFGKVLTATQGQTPSVIKRVSKTISLGQSSVASFVRAVTKAVPSLTQSNLPSLTKSARKTPTTTQASTTTISKQARRIASITQAQALSIIKRVGRISSLTQTSSLTFAATKVNLITLSVAQATAGAVVRSARATRTATVASAGAITMGVKKTVSLGQATTATVTRSARKTLSSAQAQVATVTSRKAFGLILTATKATTAAITRRTSTTRPAVSPTAPSLARLIRFTRSASQGASTSALTSRGKILSAVTSVIAFLDTVVKTIFHGGSPGTLTMVAYRDTVAAHDPVTDQDVLIFIDGTRVADEIPHTFFQSQPVVSSIPVLDQTTTVVLNTVSTAQTLVIPHNLVSISEVDDDLVLTVGGSSSLTLLAETLMAARETASLEIGRDSDDLEVFTLSK